LKHCSFIFILSDIVALLLRHQANVHITDSIKGQTSLMLAASLSDTECMRLLLDYSADPNCQDIFGQTPLHHGKNSNNFLIINKFISKTKKKPRT
jgi:ankyrin repeat protein